MDCSIPGFPVHHHLPEHAQTHIHWVGDAIQPSHPLSSPLLLPSIFPSVRVFFNESVLHIRWPKIWSFSISPSNKYSGLISFRIDLCESPRDSQESSPTPQFKTINSSSFSFLYGPTLSHPYMTTEKTIAIRTFEGKVMSLLFNMQASFFQKLWQT